MRPGLRMVLAASGIFKTERELRELCDCTALEGTAALKAIDAARALGLGATSKQNLTFDELEAELERGLYPIVYVNASLATDKLPQRHAVVVAAAKKNEIQMLDPTRGEITLTKELFLNEWNAMYRLTILVEK